MTDMTHHMLYTGTRPTRAHHDDAGFDLFVNGEWTIQPGQFVDIDLNTAVYLPPYTWGLLTGRSSTLRKRGLLVAQGVIDTGYTGPLFAGVWNLTQKPITVEHGDRIAQLVIMPNLAMETSVTQVDKLPATSRGTNGFGSTGH